MLREDVIESLRLFLFALALRLFDFVSRSTSDLARSAKYSSSTGSLSISGSADVLVSVVRLFLDAR